MSIYVNSLIAKSYMKAISVSLLTILLFGCAQWDQGLKSVGSTLDRAVGKPKSKSQNEIISASEWPDYWNDNDVYFKGNLPIHTAILKGDTLAFAREMNNPANRNVPNTQGMSPLYIASVTGQLEMVKTLLSAKANVEQRDIQGYSPLFQTWVAAQYAQAGRVKEYAPIYDEIIERLRKAGASFNTAINNGLTPAMWWLMKTDMWVDQKEGNFETTLDPGASDPSWTGFLSLIEINRKFDLRPGGFANDMTILHFAALGCRPNMVEMIIKAGGIRSSRNGKGLTALDALRERQREVDDGRTMKLKSNLNHPRCAATMRLLG